MKVKLLKRTLAVVMALMLVLGCAPVKPFSQMLGMTAITAKAAEEPEEPNKMTGHIYDDPVWNWSEDYSSASAKFLCTECDYEETIDAVVTSETFDPTYENDGKIIFTAKATFEGTEYTDTKEVAIPQKVLVAAVGDKKFDSLKDAIDAAYNDETIVVYADVDEPDTLLGSDQTWGCYYKNIEIDLNGHTVTFGTLSSNYNITIGDSFSIKNMTDTDINNNKINANKSFNAINNNKLNNYIIVNNDNININGNNNNDEDKEIINHTERNENKNGSGNGHFKKIRKKRKAKSVINSVNNDILNVKLNSKESKFNMKKIFQLKKLNLEKLNDISSSILSTQNKNEEK